MLLDGKAVLHCKILKDKSLVFSDGIVSANNMMFRDIVYVLTRSLRSRQIRENSSPTFYLLTLSKFLNIFILSKLICLTFFPQ
jgi:hypothetical protein